MARFPGFCARFRSFGTTSLQNRDWKSLNPSVASSQNALSFATNSSGTFKYSDLEVNLAGPEALKPKPDVGKLIFGKVFTDHMFKVEHHSATGWEKPQVVPFANLSLHPAAKVLHYALELFEGMKAYRGVDGKIRLFRPDLNMLRIIRSAKRQLFPTFDTDEFVSCLKRLIKIDEEWVPHSESSSLYLRPTYIGTDPSLGVTRSQSAMLYVIMCPVGPYFASGNKSVALLADPQYVRSWPGGCGDSKLGSNYGPTIYVGGKAEAAGCQQVLWLFGEDHQITEVGAMNIFVVIKDAKGGKELITPPLNGLILPGVTRQSILDLSRDWKEFKVTERQMTMQEIVALSKENRLLECFGAGTAAIVSPVHKIVYQGKDIHIPTIEQKDALHPRFLKSLSDIYYGRVNHKWSVLVD